MENSTTIVVSHADPITVSAVCVLSFIGGLGVYFNVLVTHRIIKQHYQKRRNYQASKLTSFDLICFFKAIANLYILLTTFFGDFIPVALIGHAIYPPYIETLIIAVSNSIYVADEYTTILIASNRYFAIFRPIRYRKWFGLREAMGYLIAFFVIRGLWFSQQLYTKPKECYYKFDVEALAWRPTEECVNLQDLFIIFAFFAAIVTTLINIKLIIKTYRRNVISPGLQNNQSLQTNRSIKLVVQTMCQDTLFIIDLLATFKLSGLFPNRIWTFFCGSLIWISLHSLDGFFMIAFREKNFLSKQESTASRSSTVSTVQVGNNQHVSRSQQSQIRIAT